jgi:hypothetical protein
LVFVRYNAGGRSFQDLEPSMEYEQIVHFVLGGSV